VYAFLALLASVLKACSLFPKAIALADNIELQAGSDLLHLWHGRRASVRIKAELTVRLGKNFQAKLIELFRRRFMTKPFAEKMLPGSLSTRKRSQMH